ncbi:MFS transporter [Carboxylicivirga sp. N1Y90]|uniref:MFS transporter n=1 Tax=Carboxylicivirga fragile TaxID=3417571 RepID=UPI003D350C65|nr:MFS transporter [Marinilabiliaceae bacterium N1Y90]
MTFQKDIQYYKFCAYGFFKNLRFFDPFLLLFFYEKGLSFTEIGSLYAVREICINILEVPSGLIADLFGRKRAMILSFASYIISFLLFFIFNSFWGFVLAFVLYGIGDAFRTGTHKAMILAYLKHNAWAVDKTIYYGRTRSWSQRGSAMASLISAGIVFYMGSYEYIFLCSIFPYLIDLLLMVSYPDFLNGELSAQSGGVAHLLKQHFKALKKAFSQWASFRILITTSSYTGFYKAIKDYMQPLLLSLALVLPFADNLDEKSKGALLIGVIYFIIFLLTSYISRIAHLIENKFTNSYKALSFVQIIGWLGGLVGGVFYMIGWHVMAVVAFTFILLVQNVRRPIAISYVSSSFDDQIMATVMSAESQSETIFTAFFALGLGLLIDFFGIGMGLSILSAVLIVFFTIVSFLRNNFKIT